MDVINRYPGRRFVHRISATTFRSWLNQLGLSQMECARLLNIDPRTVRAWALGEREVSGPAICALELMFVVEKVPLTGSHLTSADVQSLRGRHRARTRRRANGTAARR